MVQTERMEAGGERGLALTNAAGSLVLGLAAVIAGWALGAAL
jgi:fluoride ion exporter CrcB/FEX